jgi:hypothetical protein
VSCGFYFVGDAPDGIAEPAGCFAFFFLAFLVVPDFAGAEFAADARGADGEAGVVPCAIATAGRSVATSAASKCLIEKFKPSWKSDNGVPCRGH